MFGLKNVCFDLCTSVLPAHMLSAPRECGAHKARKGIGAQGAGVAGVYEAPDLGVGSQTGI